MRWSDHLVPVGGQQRALDWLDQIRADLLREDIHEQDLLGGRGDLACRGQGTALAEDTTMEAPSSTDTDDSQPFSTNAPFARSPDDSRPDEHLRALA